MPHSQKMTEEMRRCIQECLSCHAICVETVQHCLGLGGKHSKPEHIATLAACAEMCQASANIMLIGSELHTRSCGACADFCRECADDCRAMADNDLTMVKCADTCSRCAETCAQMAHAAAH